jgi:hypothetical protein
LSSRNLFDPPLPAAIMSSIRPSLANSHSGSSLSVNTITSTTALTAAYRPPQKDYAAAFASLQSQYGTSGDFPARVAAPPKKKKKESKSASSADLRGAASSASPHTPAGATSSRTRSSPRLAPVSEHPATEPDTAGQQEPGKVSKLKRMFGVRSKGAWRVVIPALPTEVLAGNK